MLPTSRESRQKTWRPGRQRVSVLAEMALRREKVVARLAEIREQHSLTQEQAAARVGVTLRQWQRWEAGESMPYPRNLDQVASKFGLSVAEFFDEPDRTDLRSQVEGLTGRVEDLERQVDVLLDDARALVSAIADGVKPQQPAEAPAGPPWEALDRLREELAARDREASGRARHTRTSSTG